MNIASPSSAEARQRAYSVPLESIDTSDPDLFENDTIGHYFERLRREDPVHRTRSPINGDFWSVTRYQDIMAVDTNHAVYSSDWRHGGISVLDRPVDQRLQTFITMDPPQHDEHRKAVSPIVAPANLANMESLIRERTCKVLDALPRNETFNWVDRVSIELTTLMLATLFDFPLEDRRLLTHWSDIATSAPELVANEADREGVAQMRMTELAKMAQYMTRLWNERVNAPPRTDLISMLAHNPATRHMTPLEFMGNCALLIVGGNDTTRNSMSGGLLAMHDNPAEWAKLRANPALVDSLVPEIIRWQTPLMHMRRTALADTELAGKQIRRGDKVVMWYLSGNRDETAIEHPDQFIIDRARPRQHLSFGFGIHRCVGNRLAELQLKILWQEILARFPMIEVVGPPVRVRSNFVHGITELPVRIPGLKASDMLDILVVGAGFAGLYILQRARGLGLTVQVLEAGGDVGGTWYWNRYPGARCDVESLEYSYGFDEELQQQWQWSERYAAQPEILRYARHVAERFDLRRDIRFQTRMVAASFDETSSSWQLRCDDGTSWQARHLVMATGPLSSANLPDIPGRDSFAGGTYHTGQWPHEPVDFTGLRVAVIGTGSSAVQAIPVIAQQASALTVFQRTATYSLPARNQPLAAEQESEVKSDYAGFRALNARTPAAFGARYPRNEQSALQATAQEREAMFERRWQIGGTCLMGAFGDLITDAQANQFAADFVRNKIRAVVRDPATAERLLPAQPIGCKRLCLDTGYFETFNLPHVQLVDIAESGIEAIEPRGVRVAGQLHEVDAIVYATGFDAMTGSLLKPDIRGRGGLSLRDKWRAGPLNYLGLGAHGFPNLFMVCGPGSPSVLTNMLVSIEQQVNWITDCMVWMREHGKHRIEAEVDAEAQWVGHVNAVAAATLYPSCNSWYLGANVPGKVRVFMPLLGFPAYVQQCEAVAAQGYAGFQLG